MEKIINKSQIVKEINPRNKIKQQNIQDKIKDFCQKMASYTHLTMFETILMTFLTVVSIFAGIPGLIKSFKKGNNNFLAIIFTMSMVSSFFYHLCQIYEFQVFLDKGKWQRMDNVFTITSIQLMTLLLCGTLHSDSHFLQYSTFISTFIIQQKDPWNFSYTTVPILSYLVLGVFIRIKNHQTVNIKYAKRDIILSIIFLTIGILFYFDGLDDQNDYLRFSHGMWHLCVSIFGWYAIQSVQVSIKVSAKTNQYKVPTEQSQKQDEI